MDTEIINIKVDAKDKAQAQKLARQLGFSLSGVMKAYLKEFIRNKRVNVGLPEEELELTDWAKEELRQSAEDVKAGYASPSFKSADDAINWLNDKNPTYNNGKRNV